MLNKSQSQARTGEAVEKVRELRPAQPNVVRIDAQKDVAKKEAEAAKKAQKK